MRRLVRHYAGLPIDGLILAATSGEGLTLGMAELEWIVAVTRETLGEGRRYLPICLGLAGSHTIKMCHTLDETAGWPIDGYLISSPYYSRPSQRGLIRHFTLLADHASWPFMLYNIPYRAGVNLENETLLELARHPNIAGMKDCGANRAQSIDLLRRRQPGFRILTGEDAENFDALSDGADGAILLSAQIKTAASAAVRTLLKQGERDAARARWKSRQNSRGPLPPKPGPGPAKTCPPGPARPRRPEPPHPRAEARSHLQTQPKARTAGRAALLPADLRPISKRKIGRRNVASLIQLRPRQPQRVADHADRRQRHRGGPTIGDSRMPNTG